MRPLFKYATLALATAALSACATTKPSGSAYKNVKYSLAVRQAQTVAPIKPIITAASKHARTQNKRIKIPKIKPAKQLTGKPAVRYANYKATRQPDSSGYFNSIMTYHYEPGDLYQVYCAPLDITDIAFQPGEEITSIAAGDTARWQVSKTYSGEGDSYRQHLLVKPNEAGISNSLVVTTNRHTYHLQLHATKDTYMTVVKWSYPQSKLVHFYSKPKTAMGQVNVNKLDFDYKFAAMDNKVPAWMPKTIFNDGSKTYIEFPANRQESPLLFVGHGGNTNQIVNYRVEGNYYIVDRVVNQIQLRLGNKVVQILKT